MTARGELRSSEAFLARSFRARAARTRIPIWRRPTWLSLLGLLGLVVLAFVFYRPDPPLRKGETKYAWVQMLPDVAGTAGGRLVRAIIVDGDICPSVDEDSTTIAMHERRAPSRTAFPVLLCEAELSAGKPARLGDWTLPARPSDPKDIVVIGDTGCRVVYWQAQDCSDPNQWPFARIAATASRRIAAANRQSIILHVGDYHYREHPCPDAEARCAGSAYGDNWATWQVEFFEPAGDLLAAALWVTLRGNHEECKRAGAGWIFFFALPHSRKTRDACEDDMRNYSVNIGKTYDGRARRLLVLDTAAEKNEYGTEQRCNDYRDALTESLRQYGANDAELWIALHQPLWLRRGSAPNTKPPEDCNPKSASALDGIRIKLASQPDDRVIRLVVSGDTHVFQFFWPKEKSTPIQLVAGNGGTQLDPVYKLRPVADPAGKPREVAELDRLVDRNTASFGINGSSLSFAQHGFTAMHRDGDIWTVTAFDADGSEVATCHFSEALSAKPSDSATDCEPRS
jgi:Calcineurin-like phosphoesterase